MRIHTNTYFLCFVCVSHCTVAYLQKILFFCIFYPFNFCFFFLSFSSFLSLQSSSFQQSINIKSKCNRNATKNTIKCKSLPMDSFVLCYRKMRLHLAFVVLLKIKSLRKKWGGISLTCNDNCRHLFLPKKNVKK